MGNRGVKAATSATDANLNNFAKKFFTLLPHALFSILAETVTVV
jgi:hypothetical protein